MIKEKYLPYGRQNINKEDIDSVINVLKSDYLTQGPMIQKFENEVCKKVNANFATGVNSATSALHIACMALGLKEGDWLWTSPITFVASANCGIYCKAKIDFVDIDPKTGLMSIEKLREKLKHAEKFGKLPKIIIPVHLAGSSCEMKTIYELSKIYGFSIIEDASHAIGGEYLNKKVGSCIYSQITVFSFHPVKIITTGEGGMAVCNNEEIHKKLSKLRSHGITKNKKNFQAPNNDPWYYEMQELGYNYRITDLSCALGISQLKRLDQIIKERNILYKYYESLLQDLPVRLLQIPNDVKSSVHLGIIRLNRNDKEFYRKVFNTFRKNNIGVQLHYNPVHLQPYYKKRGFKIGDFPISEKYSIDAISLPLFPQIKYNEIDRVIKCLKSALIDY
tara:strand:+ start:984 stop:2159 length:1176 start_codon:yes stop_codon:yes gene_type:complete